MNNKRSHMIALFVNTINFVIDICVMVSINTELHTFNADSYVKISLRSVIYSLFR